MKRGPGLAVTRTRLAAVMWPNGKSIISCTRRLDDGGNPVGVAGPCHRLEAGEAQAQKVLSWATLGRFDGAPPDAAPRATGGRCRIELEQGQRLPTPRPARAVWVTPTRRELLDEWTPGEEAARMDTDAFTIETSLAPEGEWMAILRVAVGLGEGERVVQIASAKLVRVPSCD